MSLLKLKYESTVWQMGEHRTWQQRLDILLGFCISLGSAHCRPGVHTKHLKIAMFIKILQQPTDLQEPGIDEAEERFSPLRFHPFRRRFGFKMST